MDVWRRLDDRRQGTSLAIQTTAIRKMPLILIGCFLVLAASTARGQNASPAEPAARPGSMIRKLLLGEIRMGRNGVPAEPTYEARAMVDQPYVPVEVYITDAYGINYDSRGNRIR
jgi:hypothetical protein